MHVFFADRLHLLIVFVGRKQRCGVPLFHKSICNQVIVVEILMVFVIVVVLAVVVVKMVVVVYLICLGCE